MFANYPRTRINLILTAAFLGLLVILLVYLTAAGSFTLSGLCTSAVVLLVMLLPAFYTQYIVTTQTAAVKQANKKIEASEKTLRSLSDGLPIGIYRVKTDGTFLSVNAELVRILGYDSAEELLPVNTRDLFVHPNERDQHQRAWESDIHVFSWELQLRRKDGKVIWVRDTGRIIYGEDGKLNYLDGTLQDITDQKRVEAELGDINRRIRQAKQEWESTVDALPLFVCMVDVDRHILRVNRAPVPFDQDVRQLLDQRLDDLLTELYEEEPVRALFDQAWVHLQNYTPYSFELHKESDVMLVQMRPLRQTTYKDERSVESFAVVLLRDITEEKRLEQRLRDINAELEERVIERTNEIAVVNLRLLEEISKQEHLTQELQQALQQEKELNAFRARFGTMISHEFRTPLTIIQTSADLIQRQAEQSTLESRTALLDRIRQQVKHLVGMLEDIMTISQAETVGIKHSDKRVNLTGFAHMIEHNMAYVIKPTQTLAFSAPENDSAAVMDEKMIHQMITNLVSNASKYSPDDSTITLDMRWEDGNVVIRVKDQGIGIPDEALPHLFDAFYRAENVGVIRGTGLGLAIVKLAVDTHDGEIRIESKPNEGTTFIITLPIREKDSSIHA